MQAHPWHGVRASLIIGVSMSFGPHLLLRRGAYREDAGAEGVPGEARAHLEAASDALSMALLTLGGDDDDRGDKLRRAEQTRGFLAEAVTALSRARIYVPGIKTHTLPVLLAAESNLDAELARLHQIATRLTWQNHVVLPARSQATPLAPEEEAQLAVVLSSLSRSAKIDRALRYKWSGLAAAVAIGGQILGLPVVGALAACGAVGFALWRAARDKAGVAEPSAA